MREALATIDRIAAAWPTTTEALESINGIGPATIEQFGYDIVELVRQRESPDLETPSPAGVQREGSAEPPPMPTANAPISPQPPVQTRPESPEPAIPSLPEDDSTSAWEDCDAYWTWRLFRDGYSASQIAMIRCRDQSALAS